MIVKELIKELQKCNPNAKVTIVVSDEDENIVNTGKFTVNLKDVDKYIELFVCLNI